MKTTWCNNDKRREEQSMRLKLRWIEYRKNKGAKLDE